MKPACDGRWSGLDRHIVETGKGKGKNVVQCWAVHVKFDRL